MLLGKLTQSDQVAVTVMLDQRPPHLENAVGPFGAATPIAFDITENEGLFLVFFSWNSYPSSFF